jgi:putative FmdB family regulatory protein
MPIYEYACLSCRKSFETLILRRADEADVACPTCGSTGVSRQLSRPAATRTGGGSSGADGARAPSCGTGG